MPEERLPWGQTIISGLQHSVAMAGATIIAPLIMGFDPNLALFFSGVGTLIFFVMVGGRVPSYLGSSFSFIAVVIAASGYSGHGPNPGIDIALGGIVAAGVLYAIIALIVSARAGGQASAGAAVADSAVAERGRVATPGNPGFHPAVPSIRVYFRPLWRISALFGEEPPDLWRCRYRTISMTVTKVPLRRRATNSESSKFLRTSVQPI